MTPNADRWRRHHRDVATAPAATRVLTITGTDTNWEAATALTRLEELTLDTPGPPQLALVATLVTLKRLRLTHARPTSLVFVRPLVHLEELVLEYVSGVDDLAPLAALPKLRALHLENLRRVSDFSGLSGARQLRYCRSTAPWTGRSRSVISPSCRA